MSWRQGGHTRTPREQLANDDGDENHEAHEGHEEHEGNAHKGNVDFFVFVLRVPRDLRAGRTWTRVKARMLPREFYERPTLDVARDLIGMVLVHDARAGSCSGVIVETEAYIGESDPACHAAPGPTRRNEPLYGPPGIAYVYLNYGIHYLVNAVTEREGSPAAVLIRALEPLDGIDLMRRRRARGTSRPPSPIPASELCKGPGNLTRALGITLQQNLRDLTRSTLRIEDRGLRAGREVRWSRRIGITVGVEQEWRCVDAASRSVSGRK